MELSKQSPSHFAICVDNATYPVSLELHKMYRVIPGEEAARHGDLRVIDESGEDYLFPADYFVLIDLPSETAEVIAKSFAEVG